MLNTSLKTDPNDTIAPELSGRAAPSTQTFTGIVVNHTHWDREWYMPFQRYRVMLVDAIDHLLDILKERADYAGFMLDGQTVVTEDYLEARLEKQAELAGYVQ